MVMVAFFGLGISYCIIDLAGSSFYYLLATSYCLSRLITSHENDIPIALPTLVYIGMYSNLFIVRRNKEMHTCIYISNSKDYAHESFRSFSKHVLKLGIINFFQSFLILLEFFLMFIVFLRCVAFMSIF